MAEIVGTITNLSDFLSKTQVCLSVKPNDPQQQIICLEADRKYSIPAFQREVRWDDNNLKMLLYDLSRSSKFLGNIILTIKSDHTCEIIDGQQRTTVLKLIAGEPEFELPVEVKQQLSAGEKQIFIMALYQALSQLNKINVPYIVDTPFARIDKEHRGKILSQFFKKLNGQIIILSTDEEIVGEYRESISDIISNTFVLNHTANGNTEILANTYFGGKHND